LYEPIPKALDLARIDRRLRHAQVHLLRKDRQLTHVILPVYGSGMWSTLHGFLSLQADANTVVDLRFFMNQETPGIGDRIDDPRWRQSWRGKQLFDETGVIRIQIPRQMLPPDDPAARFQVDALSGATKTTKGVIKLLHYWLGEHGYGPYLARLRAEEGA
jgi:Na+-transporting NADH:ubiquinone oxidoreductase subunit C